MLQKREIDSRSSAPAAQASVTSDYHSHFLSLVDEIEHTFPVPVWPLARAELYLALYWQSAGREPPRPERGLFKDALKGASYAAAPLLNVWRSRSDLSHLAMRPRRADVLVLGDGVCLDKIDGA